MLSEDNSRDEDIVAASTGLTLNSSSPLKEWALPMMLALSSRLAVEGGASLMNGRTGVESHSWKGLTAKSALGLCYSDHCLEEGKTSFHHPDQGNVSKPKVAQKPESRGDCLP